MTVIDDELIAGVELGGTKAVALLARGRVIEAQVRFPTTSASQTLHAIRAQLTEWSEARPFAALGIAAFGPIRVDPAASDYGQMLATPKPGWTKADVSGELTQGFDRPWRIDTDVNAAALAEWTWGAARGLGGVCYITLGTGVGGGSLLEGRPVHGALHPEIGHLRLRRAVGDGFEGVCPFHGDCVEGLISGPALQGRFGQPGEDAGDCDPNWSFFAHDLAELIAAVALTSSPDRVLIGGGVGLGRASMLDRVRAKVLERLAGYLPHVSAASVDGFISLAGLGADAGPLGAVALGRAALLQHVQQGNPLP